ncbi:MAG: dienelactone hydrolase family protein [Ilumatobacter sp.]|uniref:alpha/beta hydrolase n=1 Tax=Ilumatobacter sp. TaxID=1967498 RepID=UPI00261D98A1|nr:dienelactone hydrolase family protein [Ilumatobacter sp.]MDJ0767421.1 dienelactone hydrolase family protein [Ilumatobacter sp.]
MTDSTGQTGERSPGPSALASLQVLARSSAALGQGLVHEEIYTPQGLLTVFRHEPPDGSRPSAAIVTCGGAMGGVLGPGHALFQRLGTEWPQRDVAVHRVGYRVPNDLDRCAHDVACVVEMAIEAGAGRVVVMGHSFGGAVAIRVAAVMTAEVAGVVTFATQSAGCEVAGALAGRPLLLFHGDRDELLPMQSSELVRMLAGYGDLVVLPGDGHLLARSDEVVVAELDRWLPGVLAT